MKHDFYFSHVKSLINTRNVRIGERIHEYMIFDWCTSNSGSARYLIILTSLSNAWGVRGSDVSQ